MSDYEAVDCWFEEIMDEGSEEIWFYIL
jgi:hypothetical protein